MPDPDSNARVLWRAYVPQWSYLPLSGEGASRFGGRWNPVGVATIYAAQELSTAWAEYNQGFVQHPALIAQLELTGASLLDLTDEHVLARWGEDESLHHIEWRAELQMGKVPRTHSLNETARNAGFHGVIFPSFMSPGGSCVALWNWNGPGDPKLRVIDPEGRLPVSMASWT